jgi:hypothetical protein
MYCLPPSSDPILCSTAIRQGQSAVTDLGGVAAVVAEPGIELRLLAYMHEVGNGGVVHAGSLLEDRAL